MDVDKCTEKPMLMAQRADKNIADGNHHYRYARGGSRGFGFK
jgi:hypothetical protein